jgi:hypothetical protein
VAAIADVLPVKARRIDVSGELPEVSAGKAPSVVVLHRPVLTGQDIGWLDRLRSARSPRPRVVLVFGAHVRHGDLERWSDRIDVAIHEAAARETIARHVVPASPRVARTGPRPDISVVSTNSALRQMLVDACTRAGYAAEPLRDWTEAPASGPAVWDIPVLEPGWPEMLERRARAGPVVALIGLADRALVTEALARGAFACLDLPVDLADLTAALDRLPASRGEPAHPVPPSPARLRRSAAARTMVDPATQA